ncbi:MAG: hypothetical protein CCU26_02595 [Nitrospira sp. UW-LDO-01]|nr:MAG: hypothetical protein CCU26_02595 [Nitrospira sp. UW-LDO-01]
MSAYVTVLNSCKYLYLTELGEPTDNVLRIVLTEAALGRPLTEESLSDHQPEIRAALASAGVRAIEHHPGCRTFELVWPSYIGYSVRDESFSLPESEEGEGQIFVQYTKSKYLDFITTATFANSDFPGPFKHWAIYCLNHSLDVVSTKEPIVEIRNN